MDWLIDWFVNWLLDCQVPEAAAAKLRADVQEEQGAGGGGGPAQEVAGRVQQQAVGLYQAEHQF